MRFPVKIFLGVMLSFIGIWFFFREQSVIEILSAITEGKHLFLLGAIIIIVCSVFIRAWRWQFLLPNNPKVSLVQSYKATMIGNMANNILPLRLGEIARLFALRMQSGMQVAHSFPSILIERVLDLVMIIIIFLIGWFVFPDEMRNNLVDNFQIIFLGLIIFLIIVLGLAVYFRNSENLIGNFVRGLLNNLYELFQHNRWIMALLISLILWGMYLLSTIFVLYAFHLPHDQLLTIGIIYLAASSLAYSIPSAPGAVGTYHGMSLLLLGGIVSSEVTEFDAGAAILVMHANVFILFTLLGIIHMLSLDLGLRDILKNRKKYE